jgi:hypothetical protein
LSLRRAPTGSLSNPVRPRFLFSSLFLAAIVVALAVPSSQIAASSRQRATGFPGGPYFNVVCGFSHRNNDDPIMHPGHPGLSHNHTYTGNRSVDASSTPASLRGGSTTCDLETDASGYWAPTLYVDREAIHPLAGIVYYVRRTAATVSPFPEGLEMIAGNPNARKPQKKTVVSWGCGGIGGGMRYAAVPVCADDQALELRVQFPSCWSGKSSDSSDHRRHMAYASGGRCPESHPVAVPTMLFILLYPPVPQRARVVSGKFGAHADFMNGWNQDSFAGFVAGLNY